MKVGRLRESRRGTSAPRTADQGQREKTMRDTQEAHHEFEACVFTV